MSLSDCERREVEAAVAPVPGFVRGRLRALARSASGEDLERINDLLVASPPNVPVGEEHPEAIARGVERAANWKWRP